jgi:hypothetical protein
VVESSGLLNRRTVKSCTESSNLSLSAILFKGLQSGLRKIGGPPRGFVDGCLHSSSLNCIGIGPPFWLKQVER